MNLLISKLMHWFVFGSSMFFAAGAVADVGAPAPDAGASAPTAETPSTPSTETTSTPTETPAANLSDAVKRAVENAEKSLAKPGVPAETVEAPKTEDPRPRPQPKLNLQSRPQILSTK